MERQGGGAGARDEGGNHVVVDRQGEDEESARHHTRQQQRQGDPPEGVERSGAEIARCLLQRRIEAGQAGAHDDRDIGDAEHHVSDDHRRERQAQVGDAEKGHQRRAEHDLRDHHGQHQKRLRGALAAEAGG